MRSQTTLFSLPDVLSATECAELVALTEDLGFGEAPINSAMGAVVVPSVRNNTRVMIDDTERADWLWARVREAVPPTLRGYDVVGLNERFRYYRYTPGQFFAWHCDGSYARSPYERSLLTLMVYLNDGFEGGSTEFEIGQLSRQVHPVRGAALVFDHGLRHQGAEVELGSKYVLRSDVMYRLPGRDY